MSAIVPTTEEFDTLAARVAQLEMRVTQLETTPPVDNDYPLSDPIVATSGQHIQKIRITGCPSHAITIKNATDVTIEDVQLEETGGHGIYLSNAQRVTIVNSLIRPKRTKTALDSQHAICVRDGSTDILIQGNIMKDYESGVHVMGGHSVTIRGNYGEFPKGPFPRGQHVQCYPVNQNGPNGQGPIIEDNYFVSEQGQEPINDKTGVEDAINIGAQSAYARILRNYVIGGRAMSGCGIILEGGCDHGLIQGNTLIRTSQVGVNVVNSAYAIVEGNKALDTNLSADDPNLGNLGLGAWYHTGDTGCHDNIYRQNIVSNKLASGSYNDIWLKGGCGTQTDNIKGSAARAQLTPEAEKLPPPSIPPKPWVAR
jgi:Right handed beta helix region